MVAVACARCGAPAPPGARFCGVCGNALPAVATPGPVGPLPPFQPGYPQWVTVPPRAPGISQQLDGPVLSDVQTAAVIALIGAGLGLFLGFGLGPLFHVDLASGIASASNSVTTLLYYLELLVLASVALTVTSIYFLRTAFARLAPIDEEFRTPSTLALAGIAGLLLVLLGFVVLVQALITILNCAGITRPIPTSCVDLGAIFEGVGVILLGAIIALIGIIGIAIGIWRLGTRYDEETLHIGAVLWVIIPVVGQILVLYGVHQARQRLSQPGQPASMQSLGY